MTSPLRVGDVLHGFCGGAFGRDSYGCKRVEGLGADWVVARDPLGRIVFSDSNPEDLVEYRAMPVGDCDCKEYDE